jgi:hypothetical protein
MVAEVIASAFASGFSWGGDAAGKRAYCASPDLKGGQIMIAFEQFLRDNPKMADEPYGAAMAGTLSKAFPCSAPMKLERHSARGNADDHAVALHRLVSLRRNTEEYRWSLDGCASSEGCRGQRDPCGRG